MAFAGDCGVEVDLHNVAGEEALPLLFSESRSDMVTTADMNAPPHGSNLCTEDDAALAAATVGSPRLVSEWSVALRSRRDALAQTPASGRLGLLNARPPSA